MSAQIASGTAHSRRSPTSPSRRNDGHSVLQNGTPVGASGADSLVVIDLSGAPKVIGSVAVPGSVVGPPTAVALTRDGRYAIVTSATKLDPQDKTKNIPDTRAFVVELGASPKVVGEVATGLAPASVALSPDNTLALIANRNEGTVSVFKWAAGSLTPLGKIDTGNPKSEPERSSLFLPDGKAALLSRDGDNTVSVLRVDGETVTIDKRPLTTGIRPYTMALSGSGRHAAVTNMGRGDGDTDTVSLIDVSREPFRVVDTVATGSLPEGVRFSPDGAFLAIVAQEGSTKPKSSPFATRWRPARHVRRRRRQAASRGGCADRPLVAGCGILARRQDRAGAEHGGAHDLRLRLGWRAIERRRAAAVRERTRRDHDAVAVVHVP